MTRTAKVIIGANWGDEGKGLLTDYFASNVSVVVRFSGGANAGHTVVTPEWRSGTVVMPETRVCAIPRRHVFHHIGSGAFRGSQTHLSKHFISNPLRFRPEIVELAALNVNPSVNVDPRGFMTTPYDMMINQMAEQARDKKRHGSTGVGINETIKRFESGKEFRTPVSMVNKHNLLCVVLTEIRECWVPTRLKQLSLTMTDEWQTRFDNPAIIDKYLEDVAFFGDNVTLSTDRALLGGFGAPDYPTYPIIFEGSQGLLLDQHNQEFFPYVTHASTGLTNVLEMTEDFDELEVTYVTRAYATRHGAGPFPNATPRKRYEDHTNVSNDWQGSIRFGLLDLGVMARAIQADLSRVKHLTSLKVGIAVTHLDQMGKQISYAVNGKKLKTNEVDFREAISDVTGIPVTHISRGPTRYDVKDVGHQIQYKTMREAAD